MRIIQILFCSIMLATLAIPGWFTMMKPFAGQQARTSPTEQRRLVQFKQIRESWPNIKSTVQTFGQAFDDQLFARTEILQAVNGVLVEQGRHSTSDTILFGEDGYQFLIRRRSEKTFVQIPCAVPGGLDEMQRQLTIDTYIKFAQRMQTKNVETRLVIIPTKSSIYPEKLPKYVHSICVGKTPSTVDTVKQIKGAGLSARYDWEWFRTHSPEGIFQPHSFHWVRAKSQMYAQFLYGNHQMSLQGSNSPPYETKPLQTGAPADISRHLGIKADQKVFYGTKYDWPDLKIARRHEFKNIENRNELLAKLDASVWFFSRHKSTSDKKLLMVGDSFSDELFTYWASSAGEAIFMNDTNAAYTPGIIDETVSKFGANIVVFVIEESKFTPIKTENYPYPFATKLLPPE